MSNEAIHSTHPLSQMPDSMLKAQLIPDEDREQESQQKINAYVENAEISSETAQAVSKEMLGEQARNLNGKQVVLDELRSIDPQTAQSLDRREQAAQDLHEIVDMADNQTYAERVAETLLAYVGNCTERQREIISRIHRDIRKKNFQRARSITRELITDLESIDLQWKDTLAKTDLPVEILDNIESVINGHRIRSCLRILESKKTELSKSELVALRAKNLAQLIQTEFGSEIALDVIEGRYDMEDPIWNGNLVAAYLPIQEQIQSPDTQKKSSLKSRIILAGVVALLAAGMIFATTKSPEPAPNRPQTSEQSPNNQSQPEEQQDQFGDGEGSESDELGDEPENAPAPPRAQDKQTPENSEHLGKTVYWRIDGTVPDGYFQETTSNEFRWNQWETDTASSEQLWPVNVSGTRVESPTHLTSAFPVGHAGERFNIPVPAGWEITYIQVGESDSSSLELFRARSGSYVAEITSNLDAPQTLMVGLRPVDATQNNWTNAPNRDYADRSTIQFESMIGDPNELDQEVLNRLNSIRDNATLSDEEKAQAVTEFVRDHFIYSLDSKYSDFYLEDASRGEYVRRAWQVGYGDCDVVNTINVAFLRYVGVDARLASGFANSSSLLNVNRKSLEQSEAHGWAQFFNRELGRWVDADATPGVVDPGSLGELMNLNGGAGIEQIFNIRSLKDLIRTMSLMLNKASEFATSELGIVSEILSVIALYALLYGIGNRLEAKNEAALNKLTYKLQEGDGGPYWKPKNRLSEIISNTIRTMLHSKSNYLATSPSFLDKILLLPRIIKAKKDKKLIQPVNQIMTDSQAIVFDPAQDSVPKFVHRVAGIDEAQVNIHTRKEHLRSTLNHITQQFNATVTDAFPSSLTHRDNGKGVTPSMISYGVSFRKHADSEVFFVNDIMDQLYQQYLRAVAESNRQRAKAARKKIPAREIRDTIPPEGREIRIANTPNPISKIEFIRTFAPEISLLIKYHQIAKLHRELTTKKNSDVTAD